jgi:hypothetical protein
MSSGGKDMSSICPKCEIIGESWFSGIYIDSSSGLNAGFRCGIA